MSRTESVILALVNCIDRRAAKFVMKEIMKFFLRGLPLLLFGTNLLAQSPTPDDTARAAAEAQAAGAAGCLGCAGCGGSMLVMMVLIVGSIVLSIALLIWVARDAKNRGMDNAVMWMILVFFTNVLGLIIYIFSRPQGDLVECPTCKNKRLQASAKCPHCGNP